MDAACLILSRRCVASVQRDLGRGAAHLSALIVMFNGRRIDLEQLAGQARALWLAREDMVARSRMVELFSQAALLALFVVVISTANQLSQIQFQSLPLPALLPTLPSLAFPFAILAIALLILRRINVQVSLQLPNVQLPFDAAPLMQRASLHISEFVARLKALGAALPLALPLPLLHVHLDDSEAVQSMMLFAQRMSRNWLEVRALLESLVERTYGIASVRLPLIKSSLVFTSFQAHLLARAPQVTVMRC